MFAENINRICRERGTYLSSIVKQVKGAPTFTTAINHGSLPKEKEMIEMARLLHCSVADFFRDDLPFADTKPMDPDEYDLLSIYRGLNRREKHAFMAMIYEFADKLDPEEVAPYENREL